MTDATPEQIVDQLRWFGEGVVAGHLPHSTIRAAVRLIESQAARLRMDAKVIKRESTLRAEAEEDLAEARAIIAQLEAALADDPPEFD